MFSEFSGRLEYFLFGFRVFLQLYCTQSSAYKQAVSVINPAAFYLNRVVPKSINTCTFAPILNILKKKCKVR